MSGREAWIVWTHVSMLLPDASPDSRWRTHRLRATWALAHLRAGMQLNDVMNLAGVASWKMLGYLAPFAPSTEWNELLPKAARK